VVKEIKDKVVNSLWIENELTPIQLISINSFLNLGYKYNLYVYDDIKKIPSGVNILDGNDILPDSSIWQYGSGFNKGGVSGFANQFRWHLLYEYGGLWADMDYVLLKDFDFHDHDYVLAQEYNSKQHDYIVVSTFLIYSKHKNQKVFEECMNHTDTIDRKTVVHAQTGPMLLDAYAHKNELWGYMSEVEKFTAVARGWEEVENLITEKNIPKDAYGIHLWNAMWNDPDTSLNVNFINFPKDCVWEQLKRKYL